MTGEDGKLTLERKVEALVDQLAAFDDRIRCLEETMGKIVSWCNSLYDNVKPMVDDYQKKQKTGGKT